MMEPRRAGKSSGYYRPLPDSKICLVFDPDRFRQSLTYRTDTDALALWARSGFSDPVIYYNGYLWLCSPGPRPLREVGGL